MLAPHLSEVFDQHGLGLFAAGLVEGDGFSVGSCAQPEGSAFENGDGAGSVFCGIVEAEDRLVSERGADEKYAAFDGLPTFRMHERKQVLFSRFKIQPPDFWLRRRETLKNREIFRQWIRSAGNPLAENNLGDMYLRGEGVPQDNAAAFTASMLNEAPFCLGGNWIKEARSG